jgi:zinc/manganese transport system permease protein
VFTPYLINTWITATTAAVIAGAVGHFVVLRGASFAAHAIPKGAFAGAAAASLLGLPTLAGLVVCAVVSAIGIGRTARAGRHDAATALALSLMLGSGALFLSMTSHYAPEVFALLFGEVLGVNPHDVLPTVILGLACLIALMTLDRPLTLTSIAPQLAQARGITPHRVDMCFLTVLALATSLTVPVVGTLLVFSLMIGPATAARSLTGPPTRALALSIAFAAIIVWAAIACSYQTDWPVGFFVGVFAALAHGAGRLLTRRRRLVTDGQPSPPLAIPG